MDFFKQREGGYGRVPEKIAQKLRSLEALACSLTAQVGDDYVTHNASREPTYVASFPHS